MSKECPCAPPPPQLHSQSGEVRFPAANGIELRSAELTRGPAGMCICALHPSLRHSASGEGHTAAPTGPRSSASAGLPIRSLEESPPNLAAAPHGQVTPSLSQPPLSASTCAPSRGKPWEK